MSASDQEAAERRAKAREALTFDRWENGLDVKTTSLFNSNASSLTSPSLMLTAQWNYRFHSETYLVISISGMPYQATAPTTDGSRKTYTAYYGGPNLAQSVFAYGPYRLVLAASAGIGVVYVRDIPPGDPTSNVERPNFRYVELGGFFTFFEYSGMDLGVSASYRLAQLTSTVPDVSNADVSSPAFGLTVRVFSH